ncbi:hypothetical protein GEMRC1_004627 [Eukaryota sp. GEM-RC1]
MLHNDYAVVGCPPHSFFGLKPRFCGRVKGSSDAAKIVEVLSTNDLIVYLDSNGIARVADMCTLQSLGKLQIDDNYIVRSLFAHHKNRTILTVATKKSETHLLLHVISFPVDFIKQGRAREGATKLFTSETFRHPGFVEFESKANRAITYSAPDQTYRIWELNNYHFLYSISSNNVLEVKLCPDRLVVFHQPNFQSQIPILIYDLVDGSILCTTSLKLQPRGLPHPVTYNILYTEAVGDLAFCFCPLGPNAGFMKACNMRTMNSIKRPVNETFRDNRYDGLQSVSSFLLLHSASRIIAFSRKGFALLLNDELELVNKLPSTMVNCDFDDFSCTVVDPSERFLVSVVENASFVMVVNIIDPITGSLLHQYDLESSLRENGLAQQVTAIWFVSEDRRLILGHLDSSLTVWQL